MKEAAVSWVERDGKVLVVWNRRYRGWTLPGGLIEDGETPPQGMARELREETGLVAVSASVLYDAPAELIADGPKNRGSHVWVFRCDETIGVASERETGCPIMWVTRDEFLALCPFKHFYERMFKELGWDFAEESPDTKIHVLFGDVLSVATALIACRHDRAGSICTFCGSHQPKPDGPWLRPVITQRLADAIKVVR